MVTARPPHSPHVCGGSERARWLVWCRQWLSAVNPFGFESHTTCHRRARHPGALLKCDPDWSRTAEVQ